jgi:hypothetical protein
MFFMKRTILKWLCVAVLFISCTDKKKKSPELAPTPTDPTPSAPMACYEYKAGRDTIILKILPNGDSVSGDLVYKLYEKDRNTGTIRGSLKDGLLVADYTFQAEGMISVRQVVFQKQGIGFVEGYGEIIDDGNKMLFKDIRALTFDSTRLVPVDCR